MIHPNLLYNTWIYTGPSWFILTPFTIPEYIQDLHDQLFSPLCLDTSTLLWKPQSTNTTKLSSYFNNIQKDRKYVIAQVLYQFCIMFLCQFCITFLYQFCITFLYQFCVMFLFQFCNNSVSIRDQFCINSVSFLYQFCINSVSILNQFCFNSVSIFCINSVSILYQFWSFFLEFRIFFLNELIFYNGI